MNKNTPHPEVGRSETDVFSEPEMDISLQSRGMFEYHPISSIGDHGGPISFQIKGNDAHYVDLSESLLYMRCKITDSTGADIPQRADVKVAPVNNFLHSLFQQCSVFLNETQITPTTSMYAYRAYIETVLAFGGDYKDSLAITALYVKNRDSASVDDAAHEDRQRQAYGSLDLIGRPFADIFAQTRYLMPGIDIRVNFARSTDDFVIHSQFHDPQLRYKVNITEAKFMVKKHTLLPSILNCHLKIWAKGQPACYPMRRIELKTYTLPLGTVSNVNENLMNGLLPDRIILCLVDSEKMNGTVTSNPFDFTVTEMRQISVTANGEELYHQAYQYNAVDDVRIPEAYHGMFSGLGLTSSNEGPAINIAEYTHGKTFFVFNLRNMQQGYCPPRHGNVKINIQFAKSTTRALNVICHADYQSTLYIDAAKNVYFKDYSRA